MIKCSQCGHDNEPIFRYCIKCGHELKVDKQTIKVEASQTPGFYVYPIRKDGKVQDPLPLQEGVNIIGANETSQVRLQDDRWVENKHAEINVAGDKAFISDLNTTFGTYVRIRREQQLTGGDEIRIGRGLFRLDLPWSRLTSGPDNTVWLGTQESESDVFGRLLRIGPGDTVIQAFLLRGKSVVIGRKQGDILLSNDMVVSGKHAEIVPVDENNCLLRDLGSLNGSYYRIRDSHPLGDGDYFLVGGHLMLFREMKG